MGGGGDYLTPSNNMPIGVHFWIIVPLIVTMIIIIVIIMIRRK